MSGPRTIAPTRLKRPRSGRGSSSGSKVSRIQFQNDIDTLQLDDALWGGRALTTNQILEFAEVSGSTVLFDFGGGNPLTIDRMANVPGLSDDELLAALANDLVVV